MKRGESSEGGPATRKNTGGIPGAAHQAGKGRREEKKRGGCLGPGKRPIPGERGAERLKGEVKEVRKELQAQHASRPVLGKKKSHQVTGKGMEEKTRRALSRTGRPVK